MNNFSIDNGTLTQEIKDKYTEILQNECINYRVQEHKYKYDDETLTANIFIHDCEFVVMVYNDDFELLDIYTYDRFDNFIREWRV